METLQVGIRSSSLHLPSVPSGTVYHQRWNSRTFFWGPDSLDDGSEPTFQGHVIKVYKHFAECPHFVDRWHRAGSLLGAIFASIVGQALPTTL